MCMGFSGVYGDGHEMEIVWWRRCVCNYGEM